MMQVFQVSECQNDTTDEHYSFIAVLMVCIAKASPWALNAEFDTRAFFHAHLLKDGELLTLKPT